MYKKLLFGAALFCGFSTFANAHNLVDIDGTYMCSVNDTVAKNTHATGRFTLAAQGNIYAVTQLNTDGTQSVPNEYHIFGMRSGNVLSLVYQNVKDANVFGLEQMKISKDGKTLMGTFIYWNQFATKNMEVCKRV
ncbi:MAG: hypothetical protein EXR81_02750 [Gammaproteobacteria bacterium]|nr:hypothetical protein [Gammaproteobacteria bacterium]